MGPCPGAWTSVDGRSRYGAWGRYSPMIGHHVINIRSVARWQRYRMLYVKEQHGNELTRPCRIIFRSAIVCTITCEWNAAQTIFQIDDRTIPCGETETSMAEQYTLSRRTRSNVPKGLYVMRSRRALELFALGTSLTIRREVMPLRAMLKVYLFSRLSS